MFMLHLCRTSERQPVRPRLILPQRRVHTALAGFLRTGNGMFGQHEPEKLDGEHAQHMFLQCGAPVDAMSVG